MYTNYFTITTLDRENTALRLCGHVLVHYWILVRDFIVEVPHGPDQCRELARLLGQAGASHITMRG